MYNSLNCYFRNLRSFLYQLILLIMFGPQPMAANNEGGLEREQERPERPVLHPPSRHPKWKHPSFTRSLPGQAKVRSRVRKLMRGTFGWADHSLTIQIF